MIELKDLPNELNQARAARINAQREGFCIEEIIGLMRQPWHASARLDLVMRGNNSEEPLPN
jgi:hypothetical protein